MLKGKSTGVEALGPLTEAAPAPETRAYIEAGAYELDVGGGRFAATAHLRPPYDAKGARIRA